MDRHTNMGKCNWWKGCDWITLVTSSESVPFNSEFAGPLNSFNHVTRDYGFSFPFLNIGKGERTEVKLVTLVSDYHQSVPSCLYHRPSTNALGFNAGAVKGRCPERS